MRRGRAARPLGTALVACVTAVVAGGCALPALVVPRAHTAFRPTAPALRGAPLYFYPATDATRPPRAVVFFFGNDVGFWRAHQRLAQRLAAHQYAVVGFDVRRALGGLPDGAGRAAAYLVLVDSLIAGSRRAVDTIGAPLVIAGHSVGAELAVWTAARLALPAGDAGPVGVVALSPGARGHLHVGLSDLLGREPHGADSFAVDSEVARLVPRVRVALVRGTRDDFRRADPAIVAAGARRFAVEGEGHSLLNQDAAEPVVLAALAYALGAPAAPP